MNPSAIVNRIEGRRVAVFGAGVSGHAAADLVRRRGGTAALYDERVPGVNAVFDSAIADCCDLVVRSPGFPTSHPWIAAARGAGVPVIGETDLAAAFWPGRLYGVTGTNGKTTTARLLAEALAANVRDAGLFGNSGTPFSRRVSEPATPDSVAVLELSSFQGLDLEHLRLDALVWTNFAEDHLDVHPDLGSYFAAKARIARLLWPGAPFLCGESVPEAAAGLGVMLEPAPRVVLPGVEPPPGSPLARAPFLENYALVVALWEALALDPACLRATAATFRLSPARMELVGSFDGVTYINDSKATNPHAALAALRGLSGRVLWLGGGSGKGGSPAAFARELRGLVERAFVFGAEGPALARELERVGIGVELREDLAAAVQTAVACGQPGDTVILSPGYASFDAFSGYLARGEAFRNAVLALKRVSLAG